MPRNCARNFANLEYKNGQVLIQVNKFTKFAMKPTIHLLLTLAFFAARQRAVAQVPFALSASLTNGNWIWSVITADVNNDGKPDLICAGTDSADNPTNSQLSVWTNNGNGLFVSNASYTVGSWPRQVIAADVNNDGKPDLITANYDGKSLTVLTNDGSGGFVLADTVSAGLYSYQDSVAAADLFGNGRMDLISANSASNSFTVWSNSGGGNFASYLILPAGLSASPRWVTTADVNADGKPDIVGACDLSGVGAALDVWTNDGAGGFAAASVPTNLPSANCVAVADVNGDGKPDLILASPYFPAQPALEVVTNSGSGEFAYYRTYRIPGNTGYGYPWAVVAADVNGDEKVDLITCNGLNGTLTILTNNGSRNLYGYGPTLNVGGGQFTLTASDINGDGRVDLISASDYTGVLTVLTNASTFLPRLTMKTSGNNVIVTWPAIWANWTLQQNTSLDPGTWTSFGAPIGNNGTTKSATNSALAGNRFFRLSDP